MYYVGVKLYMLSGKICSIIVYCSLYREDINKVYLAYLRTY